MNRRTLADRLAALEAGKQRRRVPTVLIYDADIPGGVQAAVEQFIRDHGRRPAALLPDNRRGDR